MAEVLETTKTEQEASENTIPPFPLWKDKWTWGITEIFTTLIALAYAVFLTDWLARGRMELDACIFAMIYLIIIGLFAALERRRGFRDGFNEGKHAAFDWSRKHIIDPKQKYIETLEREVIVKARMLYWHHINVLTDEQKMKSALAVARVGIDVAELDALINRTDNASILQINQLIEFGHVIKAEA